MQQLGGTHAGSVWWSYSVLNGTLVKYNHFSHGPGKVCHDVCGLYAFQNKPVDDGLWHHVALTWRVGEPASIFVDGVHSHSVKFQGAPKPIVTNGTLTIGQNAASYEPFSGGGFSASQPPNGQLDNFYVWSVVRPAVDIASAMHLTQAYLLPSNIANVIVAFTFDDHSGLVTVDVPSEDGEENSTRIVAYTDHFGNVLYGGYLGANKYLSNLTALGTVPPPWPHLTNSYAPVVGVGANAHAVKFSEPSIRIAVSLPFSVEAPCDSIPFLRTTVQLTSLPTTGELMLLDSGAANVTAAALPAHVHVFNGTAVHPKPDNVSCVLLGAGMVTYRSPPNITEYMIESNTRHTFVYNVSSQVNATGARVWSTGTVSIGFDGNLSVDTSATRNMRIGRQNDISLGVTDSGEFHSDV